MITSARVVKVLLVLLGFIGILTALQFEWFPSWAWTLAGRGIGAGSVDYAYRKGWKP